MVTRRYLNSICISGIILIYFTSVSYQFENCNNRPDLQKRFSDLFRKWDAGLGSKDWGPMPRLPDLSEISKACPKRTPFYNMNPEHMKAVAAVKEILFDQETASDCLLYAKALRDQPEINPKVWFTALMSVTEAREDMRGLKIPSIVEMIPDLFIKSDVLAKSLAQAVKQEDERICIRIDETIGIDNGVENELWYFREDIGANANHWFWHILYPTNAAIEPDRRGELFYYFHHSILARYNAERLALGLSQVVPTNLQNGYIIPDGYISHLTDLNSGMNWLDRPPNTPLINVDILLGMKDDIDLAIEQEAVLLPGGGTISLNSFQGITLLADVLEASIFSVNPDLYGHVGFHNYGHIFISESPDPGSGLMGVMGDTATAMRDPVFYQWHGLSDIMMENHKLKLAPYTPTGGDFPLVWTEVEILDVRIRPVLGIDDDRNITWSSEVNNLSTFWSEQQFDISIGLDFYDQDRLPGIIPICAKHLDHEDFQYEIVIRRDTARNEETVTATVRIFFAPRFNGNGERFSMEEQRHLFFVMDTFTTELHVGNNTILRHSTESALTNANPTDHLTENGDDANCGCGYPYYLLLPKGTAEGMIFDFFVMITNGDEDSVAGAFPRPIPEPSCQSAYILCGIFNEKYPDSKPMGYPFDRVPYTSTETASIVGDLEEYINEIPNMLSTQISISHRNEVIGRI